MGAEWPRLCRARDLSVEEPWVKVDLGDDRSHRVRVEDCGEKFLLSAVVVRQAVVTNGATLPLAAWKRNRATMLVGFRLDHRGRLVAEAWVPRLGLSPAEFQLYVRTVAVESDRFEYALTGRNVE